MKEEIENMITAVYQAHEIPHSSSSVIATATDHIFQLFYTKMEEIISSDEDLPAEHDGAVIQCGCHDMKQLNPAIKRRNELRAEQRSKLSELGK